MVMQLERRRVRRGLVAMFTADLVVAIGIVSLGLIPIVALISQEHRLARSYYYRAAAITVVDGEIEVLAAGEWRTVEEGSHRYEPRGETVASLPPGDFVVTRTADSIRLEWLPEEPSGGGPVVREARLQ